MGCEFGQGYLFAKAMPGEEMAERLRPPAVRRVRAAQPAPPRRGRRRRRAVQPARLMFLLYAVVIGLALGTLLGGRAAGLAAIRIRWPAAIVGGLLVQVALFSPPVAARVGDLGPPIYVASTLLVVAAVLRNLALPGMALVAAGAACNLVAIVANGGSMPASAAAVALMGGAPAALEAGYSNSSVAADPAPVVPHRRVRDAPRAAVRERVQRRRPADRRRDRGRDRARDALGRTTRSAAARDRRRPTGDAGSDPAPGGAWRNLPPTDDRGSTSGDPRPSARP